MILAQYADGSVYEAAQLENVNFRQFGVDGLVALRVGQLSW
jgi:hypothetical protein